MALVSTNRVDLVYRLWWQEVLDLACGFFSDPVVDPDSSLIRRAREVRNHHSRPVVFGQHIEKVRQELITLLTPDRVGDVQAEILTGFTVAVGRAPWWPGLSKQGSGPAR